MDTQSNEEIFSQFVDQHQSNFFKMLEQFETKCQPVKDAWNREDGQGHGLSCIIQDGNFFEKAGVNTSRITIPLTIGIASQMKDRKGKESNTSKVDLNNLDKYSLYANGVSLVIHPINPFIPTVHANFRYLKIMEKNSGITIDEWFGGGCDLTPIYLFNEDAKLYHQSIKDACLKTSQEQGAQLYVKYKQECDKYFCNHHRKEARGIGGVFFDDFTLSTFEEGLTFLRNISEANLSSYHQILLKRHQTPYNEENVRWRQYRRGRYVEFNLIHDRGTKFGLMTPDARIESILMSLPLIARWEYNYEVKENSEEMRLVQVLRNPVDWV